MKYLRHKQQKYRGGFTLVETLVAITILLVAIMGPMTIAARGLQTAFFAREQITAFHLAQEGVELIRARRDENALAGNGWLDGIPGFCQNQSNPGCGLDARDATIRNCSSESCQLNYDEGSLLGKRGFYTYAAGTLTSFTRQVWIDPISGNGPEAEVTVKVSWQSGLFASVKTVIIHSQIFDQYDNL